MYKYELPSEINISFLVNKLSFLKSRATIVAKGEEDYELIYEHN